MRPHPSEQGTQMFPTPHWAQRCASAHPYGFYYDHRIHFRKKKKSANCKGQDLLLREPGKYTTRPRATEQDLEVTVRNRERDRENGPGTLLLLGSEGEVSGVLWGHSLWGNLEHEGI